MGAFQTVADAFAYLEAFANFERQTPMREAYRLDRMAALLERSGNPQLTRPAIHIAGSKGKGSTAHYCAAILAEAGYRVGIYASPHLLDWRERICHPHGFFADSVYLEVIGVIREMVERILNDETWPHGEPTTFELLTLMAYLVFDREALDWMVIETGLGGALDATNLMLPRACAITALELEHTDILGNSIEEIAAQKAGIFKPGALLLALVPSFEPGRVRPVLEKAAEGCGSTLEWIEGAWQQGEDPNAKLAIRLTTRLLEADVIKPMKESDWAALQAKAISGVHLSGRLEWRISPLHDCQLLIDVAHTPQSVLRAVSAFKPADGDVLLFGSVSGKRQGEMAQALAPHFSDIVITTPGSFKKSNPGEVWLAFTELNPQAILLEEPVAAFLHALALAKDHHGRILVCGSFYLAAAIQEALLSEGFQAAWPRKEE